ncbi:hypothetical protein AA313_de0207565 [Arthrobotrys entomopaga]|nr:hypothetical protein AA313_de0207565 [Arthrobotrys entomopaga]
MNILLLASLSMALAQSSTFTSTITNVQISTYTPLVVVSEGALCNCNITVPYLCVDLISTWNPFGYSSMTSNSGASSTSSGGSSTRRSSSRSTSGLSTTTSRSSSSSTTTTTSGIPTPSNLYTFSVSDIEAIDIDSSGNMVLASPSGLTAAFVLNSDGTLTTYGSNFTLFANFGNVISARDVNTIYGLGFCTPKSTSSSGLLMDSIAYTQFFLSGGTLQFTVGSTSYGFINCVGSTISIYDALSEDIPSTCGALDLSASSVPTVSYSRYYSAGLSTKSTYTLSSCGATTSTNSMSSTTSEPVIPLESNFNFLTNTGAEADFTSPSNPYPVFAMSPNDDSYIFVGSDLHLTAQPGNDSYFHAFQTTPDDGLIFYGSGATVYANTSVSVDNSKKRALCYSSPIYLQAASPGMAIPDGATTGPFITNPDTGLFLAGYNFTFCSGISTRSIQLIPNGCPIPNTCTLSALGLFLLDEISIQQALYNADLFSQQIFTPTLPPTPSVTTIGVPETDAVDFARDQLMEGLYSDFCSSELGYFTTSAVINNLYSPVSTFTTAAYEVSEEVNYLSTILTSITTDLTVYTTTTATSKTISTYNIVSRILYWFTATKQLTSITSTITVTGIFHPVTQITTITLPSFVTTTPRIMHRRAQDPSHTLQRRTQDPALTPPSLQGYDPNIVGSGCSAYFSILQSSLGVTATSFTFFSDTTTVVPTTETSYTSTSTSVYTTSYSITGTKTSYSYTSTTTTTSTSVTTDTDYIQISTTAYVQVTDFTTEIVISYGRVTRTSTDGTTTSTSIARTPKTICSPSYMNGGGVPAIPGQTNGAYIPFNNFSFPDKYSVVNQDSAYAVAGPMPMGWPKDNPLTLYAKGNNKTTTGPNDFPAVYLSQSFSVCVGCSYYFQIEYKWWFTAKTAPFEVTNPLGYKNSQLRVLIESMSNKTVADFYANAYDNTGTAYGRDYSKNPFSVMTNNFTATTSPIYFRVGLQWLNLPQYMLPGVTLFNWLYVWNISLSQNII